MLAAFNGERSAEHASSILKHEIDFLGSYELGGGYEIALVLTILIINDNDELATLKRLDGVFNFVEMLSRIGIIYVHLLCYA